MPVIPAMNSALFGIHESLRRFDETASRLAVTAPGDDLAGDLVGLKVAKYGVQANVAVVQAADEMTGTLLDILA